MLLFKTNYGYDLATAFILKQAKKSSVSAKEKIKKLKILHKQLYKSAKIILKK